MTGNFQNIRTVYRLTGRNYLQWSPLVRTVLRCKGKPSHLTGISPKPEDPQFIVCEEEDSMIMSWLWKFNVTSNQWNTNVPENCSGNLGNR